MATSDPATDYWPKAWVKCPICGFLVPGGLCSKDIKGCAKRTVESIKIRLEALDHLSRYR